MPENIHTLWTPSPGFSIPGGACHTPPPSPPPPPLGIFPGFSTCIGWLPPRKNICDSPKNVVALYYYAKDIFFPNEMRKNLFIHVNMCV